MLSSQEIEKNLQIVLTNVENVCRNSKRNLKEISLIAVSKTQASETIINALNAGIFRFGENYAQELKEKGEKIKEINGLKPEWHFIGHLQSNKVKYIAPYVQMIHSVDSLKLALEISKQAIKNNRTIKCLLQVNTSGEYSKSGCHPDEIFNLAKSVKDIQAISVEGLMTIGSFSEDENIVRGEFRILKGLLDELKIKVPEMNWTHLSMGMSHDYHWAIEEGATFVRVGTSIFGARNYVK